MADPLDAWIDRQLAISTERLLAAVSATGLSRPGPRIGQVMRPARGSVLAAPKPVPGKDEPDYFFHWYRDAAVVMDALVALHRQGRLPAAGRGRFVESIAFDWGLRRIDGPAVLAREAWPPTTIPFLQPYVRPRAEVEALHGPAVAADVRCNPDGTLDLLLWSRPQHDGPAMRALTTMRMLDSGALDGERDRRRAGKLLLADLRFCLARHTVPCFDPWEEELGHHFYPRLVQHAALQRGAGWAETAGHPRLAARFAAAAAALAGALAAHWSEADGHYRSRMPGPTVTAAKSLDSVVLLAVLHAGLADGPFSVTDPRVEATVAKLEAFFAANMPANAGRTPGDGLILGRYEDDSYFDGGAFLPCCWALSEYRYRRGERARGDAVLDFLRGFLPESGLLPEQLDRATGAPRSARDLAWSHAAFVTAAEARAALSQTRPLRTKQES